MAARTAFLAVVFAALLAGCGSPGKPASTPHATIQWTSYGVPHVVADDWTGLGYGAGYAQARDNLCVMAEGYVTARGERSLYFGPEAEYSLGGANYHVNNLQSDLLLALYDQDPALMAKSTLSPQLKDLLAGYAQGYDRWLAEAPSSGLAKACLGQPWLKPITADDVVRRIDHIKLLAGSLALSGAIVKAAPPGSVMDEASRLAVPSHLPIDREDLGFGSNGYAFGSDMTGTDAGLLVGNPHWVWDGVNRFNQMHLTIPGELDVAGAGLLGFPGPLVGFNEGVAWTITVSTAQRFSLHELSLAPGDPLTYMVDGQAR
ncbi:MAG TPA: penicillin acylase family protein, partial [Candidatus Thermoplasmatota archaeon]|nr:penicillin acylase family protein [Candidatus Thermoplasmatota archaeon]